MSQSTVLVVSDDANTTVLITEALSNMVPAVEVIAPSDINALRTAVETNKIDLAVAADHLPDAPYLELLLDLKKSQPCVPLIRVAVGAPSTGPGPKNTAALELALHFSTLGQLPSLASCLLTEGITPDIELLQAVVGNLVDTVLCINEDHQIIFASPSTAAQLGYDTSVICGAKISSLLHPDNCERVKYAIDQMFLGARSEVSLVFRMKHLRGDWLHFEGRLSNANGSGKHRWVVLVAHNIEQRLGQEEAVKRQLFYDLQTGLLNQVALVQRFTEEATKRGGAGLLGLIFLDIDRLMMVNKTLGHDVGNAVITAMIERVRSHLDDDALFFRRGGDEFALLVRNKLEENEIAELGKKISAAFEDALMVAGRALHVSLSIGAAFYPDHGADINKLSKHASLALDLSKECSGNSFTVYSPSMDEGAERRQSIEQQIHYGLENDEFYVLYQPKIDLTTSAMIGVEALVRWNNQIFGQLAPFDFIPIAEERGLISQIGEKVLRMSCRQLREWADEGITDLTVSVNVSSKQFAESDLLKVVTDTIRDTGVDPSMLELELTESAVMAEGHQALELMKEIRSIGVAISVDDFGTGYSSLSYLESYPADRLKIDRSFLKHVPDHIGHNKLITAVINLGHDLGFKVIAEGVETIAQLEFVKDKNCDEIQGYLISKPVPASVISAMYMEASWMKILNEAGGRGSTSAPSK